MILAGLVLAGAFGAIQLSAPQASADPVDCSLVRCMECPPGTVLSPTGNDCCRCK
jgi:hypothetical protein